MTFPVTTNVPRSKPSPRVTTKLRQLAMPICKSLSHRTLIPSHKISLLGKVKEVSTDITIALCIYLSSNAVYPLKGGFTFPLRISPHKQWNSFTKSQEPSGSEIIACTNFVLFFQKLCI